MRRRGFFSTKQSIYRMICISDRTMHWMICIFTGESAEAVRSVWAVLSGICGTSPPEAYAKTSQQRHFRIHLRLNAAGCEIRSPHRKSRKVVCRICKMYQVCIIPLNAPAQIFSTKQSIYRMNCISDRTMHWMICIFTGESAEAVRSVRADLSGICGTSPPDNACFFSAQHLLSSAGYDIMKL